MHTSSDPRIVHVKLMNEYGTEFPLWAYDEDEDGPFFREDLVSAEMLRALTHWAEYFDDFYDPESGWPSQDVCRRQFAAGGTLFAALQHDLGPEITVEYRFWETLVQGEDFAETLFTPEP